MSRIQHNEQSMNGLATIETDEIVFNDGTSFTTNNFAVASDVASLQSSKMDAFTAGTGLSFTDNTLNAEVSNTSLTATLSDTLSNYQPSITAGTGLSFTDNTLNAEVETSDITSIQSLINANAGDISTLNSTVASKQDSITTSSTLSKRYNSKRTQLIWRKPTSNDTKQSACVDW